MRRWVRLRKRRYKIIRGRPGNRRRAKCRRAWKRCANIGAQERRLQLHWLLKVPSEFQNAFEPTHENMSKLECGVIYRRISWRANLRRAFSGIVAGNVKNTASG